MNRTPEPPRRWTWPHYRCVQWGLPRILRMLGGFHVTGIQNLPRVGGALIASNHLSFLDPPVVGSALPRRTYYFEVGCSCRSSAGSSGSVTPSGGAWGRMRALRYAIDLLRAGSC